MAWLVRSCRSSLVSPVCGLSVGAEREFPTSEQIRQAATTRQLPGCDRLLDDRGADHRRRVAVLKREDQPARAELFQASEELHGDQRTALGQVIAGAPKAHGHQVVRTRGVCCDLVRLVEQRHRVGQCLPELRQRQLTGRSARLGNVGGELIGIVY